MGIQITVHVKSSFLRKLLLNAVILFMVEDSNAKFGQLP